MVLQSLFLGLFVLLFVFLVFFDPLVIPVLYYSFICTSSITSFPFVGDNFFVLFLNK